jgi:CRISPR-associated protein Cas2
VIVVVLAVTPDRLRGSLTRWLLEISPGVYVGHAPARVREMLWLRIVEDVTRGRALMVWSSKGEQRLKFLVHNHNWGPVDFDGLTLMRRQTSESRQIAARQASEATRPQVAHGTHLPRPAGAHLDEPPGSAPRTTWSKAGRRRRYRNAIEQRRRASNPDDSDASAD